MERRNNKNNKNKYAIYVKQNTNLKTTKNLKLIVFKEDNSSSSYYIIDENEFNGDTTWNEIKTVMNSYTSLATIETVPTYNNNPSSFLAAINSLSY